MSKIKILFFLCFFFTLNACELNQFRNILTQNKFILNSYSSSQKYLADIQKLFDHGMEILLLKISAEHKNFWKVEDKEKRNLLPKFKYRETEKTLQFLLEKMSIQLIIGIEVMEITHQTDFQS